MPSQPHPPCDKCRLAASAHPRQSEDCLRVRVHRHAPLLARRGRRAAAAFPAQHIRSALSVMRRCVGALGCRARIRRKARNPSAPGFARWGLMLRRCVSGSPPYMRGSFGAPVSVRSARDRRWRSAASRAEMPPRIRGCLRTLRVRLRRIYPPKALLSAAHLASLSTHRRASRPARFGSSR